MWSRFLPRATFVALVLATLAAFFIAQRLKRTQPLVNSVRVTKFFSPNGDGYKRRARLSFIIKKPDSVTVSVVDDDDNEVHRLVTDAPFAKGRHVFHWNGRNDSGQSVPDGIYHLRVGLRNQGRTATTPKKIFLDTKPPEPVVTVVEPDWISPDAKRGGGAEVRFVGPTTYRPRFLVYRTGLKRARLVASFYGKRGSTEARWNGEIRRRPAPPGNYLIAVQARDAAGNLGSGPKRLPPARRGTRGHPGVVVRYLAAVTPPGPLLEGAVARIEVRARARHYRWRLRRLGSSKVLARGAAGGSSIHLRVPRAGAGIYILQLRSARHSFKTPIVVGGRAHRPVLIVASLITWQAQNPLDSNGSGWADVLGVDRQVPLNRPFAKGLPTGFAELEQPLLEWLDRRRLTYDLTTDYALAKSGNAGKALRRYRAVVFAGSETFPSARLAGLMRRYLRQGGRIASFGAGAFRRTASASPTKIFKASRVRRRDLFGEDLVTTSQPPGPIAALVDRIGLFSATGGTFGQFSELEQAQRLPAKVRVLAAAGQDRRKPALVVLRLGRGTVVRSGSIEWNRNLATSDQVSLVMERLWSLLSR